MYKPIRDYSIIGNLRSAALVAKDGSIDWAPAPFIDSPTIFAAILDDKKGGYWSICPSEKFSSTQRYIPNTNILVTQFETKSGLSEIVDFIPIERLKERKVLPDNEDTTFRLHRKVICRKGKCNFRVVFSPKLNYARESTRLVAVQGGVNVLDSQGIIHGVLAARPKFKITENGAESELSLSEEEFEFLIFRFNIKEIDPSKNDHSYHDDELIETINFWQNWVHKCDLHTCPTAGIWHSMVIRSTLLLKILFFEPVGTIAAAPTTSLPEQIGGVRNWDYRFTWIRDSMFTLNAFFKLGHTDEAEEYYRWLIAECYNNLSSPEDLQIMYGLRGERYLEEEVLTHLDGYLGSRPVRIGNAAYKQKQWDIYGSILDTAWQLHTLNKRRIFGSGTWNALRSLANFVAEIWKKPDEGLWEVRGGRSHFVHSKVMCWVALDRAIKLAEAYGFEGEVDVWRKERKKIHRVVTERGWNDKLKSFVQSFDSENLDAAVLLLPSVGFIKGDDPRMLSTVERIKKELSASNGLIYRYTSTDGLPGKEGVFLPASFWMVDALAAAGKREEAEDLFKRILSMANHTGLFSEEMDPETGEFLGNFPQALTHMALINSAFSITEAGF